MFLCTKEKNWTRDTGLKEEWKLLLRVGVASGLREKSLNSSQSFVGHYTAATLSLVSGLILGVLCLSSVAHVGKTCLSLPVATFMCQS